MAKNNTDLFVCRSGMCVRVRECTYVCVRVCVRKCVCVHLSLSYIYDILNRSAQSHSIKNANLNICRFKLYYIFLTIVLYVSVSALYI